MPPSPPLPPETQARFFVRRTDGRITGPHEKSAIVDMLERGELQGKEEIAVDRRTWKPLTLLVGEAVAERATKRGAGPEPGPGHLDFVDLPALDAPLGLGVDEQVAAPSPQAVRLGGPVSLSRPARTASLDLDPGGPPPGSGPTLAGLSLEAKIDTRGTAASPASPRGRPELAAPAAEVKGVTALTNMFEQRRTASRGIPIVTDAPAGSALDASEATTTDSRDAPDPASGLGPSLSLELVERKPGKVGPPPDAGARPKTTPAPRPTGPSLSLSLGMPLPPDAEMDAGNVASAAPAGTLAGDRSAEKGEGGAPRPRTRVRTATAARPGAATGSLQRRLPSRRVLILAGALATVTVVVVLALVFELPDRLRPEPKIADVLGPDAAGISADRFSAFSQGARRLEDAVAARKRAPVVRAEAALLLATSVVVHGGERGRLAHAEALLPLSDSGAGPSSGSGRPAKAIARARAFIALAKGRAKDAETLSADTQVADGDRAVIRGWIALGRQDFAAAEKSFAAAEASSPPPPPSKIAARFGLALAREALLLPSAATTYRAILAEVPDHFGARLGVLRTSSLSPGERRKAAEALLAQLGRDASPAERGDAQVRVAESARAAGDRVAAEAALGRARSADPAGVALAIALGDRALAEGHENEALALYKAALTPPLAAPRTPALQFARVAAFLGAGRTSEAVAALDHLDHALPHDARAAFWRGQLAERAKDPDHAAAERAFQEALARDPKFFPASLDLARLWLGRHRTQEALAVLKRAEAQDTAPVALRMALGEALLAAGNAPDAARAFRQARADDPKNAAAQLGLAEALLASGDGAGATAELVALAASPDTAKMGARIGEILVKLGRHPDALAAYQREIAAGGATASTKVAAARLAVELGKGDDALKLAQEAVDDDPRTPGALFVLAEVLRGRGDLPRAVSELRRAQALDGSPEVQLEYGRVLASLGRDDEAMTALGEARDIPEAGIERGRIHLRRGNLDQAVAELTTATLKLATNADAFLLLGQAQDRLGQSDKAEAAFKVAARLAPALGEVRYRLGRLLLDRGAAGAALPHLRAASEHLPATATWRADLYFQLGFAEQRQGSRERATAAFRRYLELAPPDAPARTEVKRQLADDRPR
jgi:tetratricopeptide (TPR) repeat protein